MNQTQFTNRKLPDHSAAEHRLDRGLASIYRDPDGMRSDLSRLEHSGKRQRRMTPWIIAGCAVIGIAIWFFMGYSSAGKFGEENISVELTGPTMLKSGEVGTWNVVWSNHSTNGLTNMTLTLERLPGFALVETRPAVADPASRSWSVPDTAKAGSGSFEFRGALWAPSGTDEPVAVTLSFAPQDWGARFERRAQSLTHVVESTLVASIDGPTQIIGGGARAYTVRVDNSGDRPASGVNVVVTPPTAFTVSNTTPDIPDISGSIAARNLDVPAHGSTTIAISGSYVEQPSVMELPANSWKAEASLRLPDGLEDIPQSSATLPVSIAQGDVLLTTLVGNSSDASVVDPGGTLPIAVSLKNQGTTVAEDVLVKIIVVPTPESANTLIDWAAAAMNGGERVENAIVFSGAQLPSLQHIDGGGGFDTRATLPLAKSIDPIVGAAGDIAFDIKATATIGKLGGVVEPRELSSNVVRIRLNSDTRVSAQARYFSDENLAIGSGPLPPQQGQTTNVRIRWKVDNTLHELAGLSMSGVVPDHVVWTGNARVAAGTIQFDAATREVHWTVNRMPTSVAMLDADFELAVSPDASDVGSPITLVKKIAFQAEDSVTHAALAKTFDDLNTNLAGDPFAAGKGVVAR